MNQLLKSRYLPEFITEMQIRNQIRRGKMRDGHARGIASELLVAIDLIRRGYEVFRPLALRASCDMVAMKEGRCYRVEVKTCSKSPKKPQGKTVTKRFSKADVFAACTHVGSVTYFVSPKTIGFQSSNGLAKHATKA